MAKIPEIGALPTPRANVGVVSDRSGEIVARAVADFGRDLQAIGRDAENRRDRFNYSRAQIAYSTADIEARTSLENDPEWQTFEERYRERMKKALENASELITDQSDRALFDGDASLLLERGARDVRAIARRQEVDWGRSELTQGLLTIRESLLNTMDPATRAVLESEAMNLLDAAVEQQYIDREEAVSRREAWRQSYAEGFVGVQHPDARVHFLENPYGTPAQFLPADVRAEMLERARDESRAIQVRSESQAAADDLLDRFDRRADALAAAREITDPEIRDATIDRVNRRFNERNTEDRETAEARFNDAWAAVQESRSTDSIRRDDWLAMSQQEQQALSLEADRLVNGYATQTDAATWAALTDQIVDDPNAFAGRNLMVDRPHLSESDFKRFTTMQAEMRGQADTVFADGFRTENQIVSESMPTNLNDEDSNAYRRAVDDRVRALERQQGREASRDEIQDIADELAVQLVRQRWGPLRNTERYRFELDDTDGFRVIDVDQVPRADREAIEAYLNAVGLPVSDDSILLYYNENINPTPQPTRYIGLIDRSAQ